MINQSALRRAIGKLSLTYDVLCPRLKGITSILERSIFKVLLFIYLGWTMICCHVAADLKTKITILKKENYFLCLWLLKQNIFFVNNIFIGKSKNQLLFLVFRSAKNYSTDIILRFGPKSAKISSRKNSSLKVLSFRIGPIFKYSTQPSNRFTERWSVDQLALRKQSIWKFSLQLTVKAQ